MGKNKEKKLKSGASRKRMRLDQDDARRGRVVEGGVGKVGTGDMEEHDDEEEEEVVVAPTVKTTTAEEGEDGDDGEKNDDEPPPDPYLLADAHYIKNDTRWRNKQRTLVFCSRGVTPRFRHLMDDIRKLLPHCKTENKFEKKQNFQEINTVCELKSCNNCIFFESRKRTDLYMWMARVPTGPTIKFQVLNVHTLGEIHLTGNCLLGSRPLLSFDQKFEEHAHLRLLKEMIIQCMGTPRNHPKQKPFHDHLMNFSYLDGKIWFRHYQIQPITEDDKDDPERQVLTEIGPRFVLEPIRILGGSFGGQTLYMNQSYLSPTALRVQAKQSFGQLYVKRQKALRQGEKRKADSNMGPNELDEVFR